MVRRVQARPDPRVRVTRPAAPARLLRVRRSVGRTSGFRLPTGGALELEAVGLGLLRVSLSAPSGAWVDLRLGEAVARRVWVQRSRETTLTLPSSCSLAATGAPEVRVRAAPVERRRGDANAPAIEGLVLWCGRDAIASQVEASWAAAESSVRSLLVGHGARVTSAHPMRGAWRVALTGLSNGAVEAALRPMGLAWIAPPAEANNRPLLFRTALASELFAANAARALSGRRRPVIKTGVVFADAAPPDPSAPDLWDPVAVRPLPQSVTPGSLSPRQYLEWDVIWHPEVLGAKSCVHKLKKRARRFRTLHATFGVSLMVSRLHEVPDEGGSSAGLAFDGLGGGIESYSFDLNGCAEMGNFALGWLDIVGHFGPTTFPIIVQTTVEAGSLWPSAFNVDVNRQPRYKCYGRWSVETSNPVFVDAAGERKLYTDVADHLVASTGTTLVVANGNGDQAGPAAGLNVIGVGAYRATSQDFEFPEWDAAPRRVDAMLRMNATVDNATGLVWYAAWRRAGPGAAWVARGVFKPEVVAPGSQVVGVASYDTFIEGVYRTAGESYSIDDRELAASYMKEIQSRFIFDHQWVESGTSAATPTAGAALAWIRHLFGAQPSEVMRAILFASCVGYPEPAFEVLPVTPEVRRSTCVFGKIDLLGVWETFEGGVRGTSTWEELDGATPVVYHLWWKEKKFARYIDIDSGEERESYLGEVARYVLPMARDSYAWQARKRIRIADLTAGAPYRLVMVWNAEPDVGRYERVRLSDVEPASMPSWAGAEAVAGVVDNPHILAFLDLDGSPAMSSYAFGSYRAFDFVAGAGGVAEVTLLTPVADPLVPRSVAWALRRADRDVASGSWIEGGYFCDEAVMTEVELPPGNVWVERGDPRSSRGRPVSLAERMVVVERPDAFKGRDV